jgi:Fe2+ transport system protein FeoA
MTLDQLPLGTPAKITRINADGGTKRRLMEMGVTPSATVEAVRWAPLGDPLDIKIRGYHLSLRREEAAAVEVVSG